jgi:hypothetical protein
MTDSTIVRVRERQIWQELGDEVVILDVAGGAYYGLNCVGSRVWRMLQKPHTVAEVRGALLAEFDVDAERCVRELSELLGRLAERGLIEVQSAA